MSTLREAAEPDWLDEEPFYNAMQRYRCAPREDQREIVACFEAVKRLVRAELAKPDHFPDAGKMVQDGWIPVAERMPDSGCVVLACYRNSAGNLRRIRAEWVAAKTQESDDASDIGEYDEATDTYYDPQGWYERIDNWDDGFSAVGVSQGEVTHWMPLPDVPQAG